MYAGRHITIVIPALNEEASIGLVLEELFAVQVCASCSFSATGTSSDVPPSNDIKAAQANCSQCEHDITCPLVDRIIVCDNDSSDNTASIAQRAGALVTYEPERGYGAACLSALNLDVKKDIIVFVDADHSVVAREIPSLLQPMLIGADLVIGSRTLGHMAKGALSIPQRVGNRIAGLLIRLLWSHKTTDLGPFRAITNTALHRLRMSDRQFGWTVEMQVRALQECQCVVEVPVTTRQRIGKSKIGGTINGVIGASRGILGTIAKLYWRELTARDSQVVSKRN